ncbi:hypothetical protein [Agrobacterium larrymoorei]|uniref:hypothetical protein n=1 Tax=Agrobacterium larrymoorei TaxID=160699 RepID=UPI00286C5C9A|nr:hypothetical protein [Agrobacterium larrymoorei]
MTDDPYSTSSNLNSFVRSNKQNKAIVAADKRLRDLKAGLDQAGKIATALHRDLRALSREESTDGRPGAEFDSEAESDVAGTPTEANYYTLRHYAVGAQGPVLGFLPAAHRRELAESGINWTSQEEQAQIIAGIGPGLAHLPSAERTDLVIATLNLKEAGHRSIAISGTQPVWGFTPLDWGGLGQGIAHLRVRERTALVRNVAMMDDPRDRAASIGGLAPGFASLKSDEVRDLARMVYDPQHTMALGDRACLAISRLGPGLHRVGSDECSAIADVLFDPGHVHAPAHPIERAWAIGGAAPGLLQKQGGSERAAFFRNMLDALDNDAADHTLFAGEVIAGWNANLNCFHPHERSQILKFISDPNDASYLRDNQERAKAISGIGAGLQYVPKKIRTEIVGMTCDQTHPQALHNPTEAIAGIGAGLKELDESQRSSIVQAALAREGRERAIAISGLGRGLEYLDPVDRERLVLAAKELSEVPFSWEIGEEPDDRSLAMYGLGRGAQQWATNVATFRSRTSHVEKPALDARALHDRQHAAHSL